MNRDVIQKLMTLIEQDKSITTQGFVADEFALRESKQTTVPNPVTVNPNTNKIEYVAPEFDEEKIFEQANKILESLNEEEFEMGILEELNNVIAEEEATVINDNELEQLIEEAAEILKSLQEDDFSDSIEGNDVEAAEETASEEGEEAGVEASDEEGEVEVQQLDDGTIVVVIDGKKYVCKPEQETEEESPITQTDENQEQEGEEADVETSDEEESIEEAFKLDEALTSFVDENFDVLSVLDENDEVVTESEIENLLEQLSKLV